MIAGINRIFKKFSYSERCIVQKIRKFVFIISDVVFRQQRSQMHLYFGVDNWMAQTLYWSTWKLRTMDTSSYFSSVYSDDLKEYIGGVICFLVWSP